MIETLKRMFAGQPAAQGLLEQREPIELATAALLIELARSDFSESSAELDAIRQLLQKRFGLGADAVEKLLTQAGRRADDAVSLHEFTHRLNTELPEHEKLGIVEMLWRVSHADGHIDKHEEQLIQRIAGLLHISDRDRVRLKLKVVTAGRLDDGESARVRAAKPPDARPGDLVHHFLEVLQRRDAHFLAGRLGLEHHLLAGEGIDAFTRLGGGLLDDFHLQKTGQREQARALQALLDHSAEGFEHIRDLLLGEARVFGNLSEDFRLGRRCVLFCHF
jgi:uncharacterized tellurite resistance protein B-like protein